MNLIKEFHINDEIFVVTPASLYFSEYNKKKKNRKLFHLPNIWIFSVLHYNFL